MNSRILENVKYKSSLAESHSFSKSYLQSIWARGFVRVQSREAGDNISLRKVELLWHNSLAQCGTVLTEVSNIKASVKTI